jgi:hypothetical protein
MTRVETALSSACASPRRPRALRRRRFSSPRRSLRPPRRRCRAPARAGRCAWRSRRPAPARRGHALARSPCSASGCTGLISGWLADLLFELAPRDRSARCRLLLPPLPRCERALLAWRAIPACYATERAPRTETILLQRSEPMRSHPRPASGHLAPPPLARIRARCDRFALGIGAYRGRSWSSGVLFRALPYPQPDQLVALYESNPARASDRFSACRRTSRLERESRDALRARRLPDRQRHRPAIGDGSADWISAAPVTGDFSPCSARNRSSAAASTHAISPAEPPTVAVFRRPAALGCSDLGKWPRADAQRPPPWSACSPGAPLPPNQLFAPRSSAPTSSARRCQAEVIGRRRGDTDLAAVRAELVRSRRASRPATEKNTGWTVVSISDDPIAVAACPCSSARSASCSRSSPPTSRACSSCARG